MPATAGDEASSPPALPSSVQVLAAKVSMKADRRLRRESPDHIRAIAASDGDDDDSACPRLRT